MRFISHSQNYEDVMLRRALSEIDRGFYIDVGANDPNFDSVTKAFYDAGWRGINIEPVTEWFEKLAQDRPEDTNLQTAIGLKEGTTTFYEIPGTGLSTSNKKYSTDKTVKEMGLNGLARYKNLNLNWNDIIDTLSVDNDESI